MRGLIVRLLILASTAFLLHAIGCIRVTETIPDDPDGSGDGAPTTITIRFDNQTFDALDPQFYATSASLGDPEAVLFIPSSQITSGFGFAGRGTVEAGRADQLQIPCENARAIGTRGGQFLNADTGAPLGTGQQKFLGIDQAYACGSTITIFYRAATTGYTTSLLVE